jgi:hypothetical protein
MLYLKTILSNFTFNVQDLNVDFLNLFAHDITVLPSSRNVPAAPLVVLVVNSYKYNGALHLLQSHRWYIPISEVAESL